MNNIKTYCINLDDRPDRWEKVQEEVKKVGLTIERFPGIKRARGWEGCMMTHIMLLELCKRMSTFMIIEDDILFLKGARKNLSCALEQLPEEWDMLYLGATLNRPLERVSPNLLRIKKGWTTHGIIYNNQHGVVNFILKEAPNMRIDEFIANVVQEKFNCYMCFPMVATQRPGYSDIVNRHQDYSVIKERYQKHIEAYHGGDIFGS